MFTLDQNRKKGKELRQAVVDSLNSLMDSKNNIIALDADLASASKFSIIKQKHPDYFIDMGISEANMVGVAAGLSLTGYIPYIHTFAPFIVRRALDQLYMSGAYSHNTINIYGSDPGFTAGFNGGTHTSYEDIAIMRAIPNMTVVDAADAVQMEWIIKEFSQMSGVHYVRGNRKDVRNIYKPGSTFEIGQGNLIRQGDDYLIVASGQLVSEALDIADILAEKGYGVDVIDMFTIKPLDKAILLDHLTNKKAVITIENHNVIGGLGSSVAEVIAENNINVPLTRIGDKDRFGQVGTPQYLQSEYGLTTEKIWSQVEKSLKLN